MKLPSPWAVAQQIDPVAEQAAQVALGAMQHAPQSMAWAIAAIALYCGTLVLLWLEQRWAEDVNLAFFQINVWVGAAVLAIVLAARMAAGGF